MKHEREGLGWTMARCWIKYKSRVVRKGMQATGGRWPVAVSKQATGEGDASKQREENEKQVRGGEMQERRAWGGCWIKYKSRAVRKGMQATGGRWPVAVSIQAMGEGDASKQQEENEKQARGDARTEFEFRPMCLRKDPMQRLFT